MLPKKNRLDRKTLEEVFKTGQFVNTPSLTFKFLLKKDSPTRVSFVVPKTVAKKATVRNELRRRGYSEVDLKKFPNGLAGVFIFGKKSTELFSGRKKKDFNPTQNLNYEIKKIFSKIN
jgi:ribonuclease P protein component